LSASATFQAFSVVLFAGSQERKTLKRRIGHKLLGGRLRTKNADYSWEPGKTSDFHEFDWLSRLRDKEI